MKFKIKMLLKVCPGSWYCLNILHLGVRYHPKQKIKNGSKQIIKYVTSNEHYRIFMKISQISRFADLFKKAKSEYLISETLFLAQLKNRLIKYQ